MRFRCPRVQHIFLRHRIKDSCEERWGCFCIFDSSSSRFLTPNRPSHTIQCSIPAHLCCQVSNHTDAILEFISVERKIPLQIVPFALKPLLEDVAAIAQPSAESEGLEIKLHAPGLSAECMVGDAYRIKQVVLILVEHALSLSCRGVIISVETSTLTCPQGPSCSDLVLRVQGIGSHMSEQEVHQLTQYVSRQSLDGGGHEERASLWICGQIVSAMGGSLGIVRDPGLDQDRGTCFFVSLSLLNWVASESTEEFTCPSLYSVNQGSNCQQILRTPLSASVRDWTAESILTIYGSQSSELQKDLPKEVLMQCPKTLAKPQSPRESQQRRIEHDSSNLQKRSYSMDPRLISKIYAPRRNPEADHHSVLQTSGGDLVPVSSTTVAIEKEERMSLRVAAPPSLLATPSTPTMAPDPLRHEGPSTNLAEKAPSISGSKSVGQIMCQRKVRVMESSSSLPVEGMGRAVELRRQPSSSSSKDEAISIPVCPSDAAPQSSAHSLRQLRLKALYVSTAPVNISIIEACLLSVGLHEVHVVRGLMDALNLFKEQPDIDVIIIDHEVPMEGMEVSKALREMQGSRRLYILMLAQVLDAQLLRLTLNYSADIVDYWLARPFSRAQVSSLLMKFFVQPAPSARPEQQGLTAADLNYLADQRPSVL